MQVSVHLFLLKLVRKYWMIHVVDSYHQNVQLKAIIERFILNYIVSSVTLSFSSFLYTYYLFIFFSEINSPSFRSLIFFYSLNKKIRVIYVIIIIIICNFYYCGFYITTQQHALLKSLFIFSNKPLFFILFLVSYLKQKAIKNCI